MSWFSKSILGLEFHRDAVVAVLMCHSPLKPVLKGIASATLSPDLPIMSMDAPEIHGINILVHKIKELHDSLATSTTRIALAIPDAVARTVVLDLEQKWNSHEEALEMIRWKLGKPAQVAVQEMQIEYQLLGKYGNHTLVLATMIPKLILSQYEELVRSAGFNPVSVDASQLALVKAFSEQMTETGTAVLVTWHAENLGIVVTNEGIPLFWRNKYLPPERGDGSRIDHELHCSLEACRSIWPLLKITTVYGFAAVPDRDMLAGLLTSLLEPVPVMLEMETLYQNAVQTGCADAEEGKGAAAVAAAVAVLL